MAVFAHWLAQSQIRRIVFMAALFPLPFLGLVSSAIVAMTAQLRGLRHALQESAFALALLGAMTLLVRLEIGTVLLFAASSWVVLLVLGSIVGRTRSLTLAVQVAVMLAIGVLLMLQLVLGDPVAYWTPILEQLYAELATDGLSVEVDIQAQAAIASAALVTGSFIGSLIGLLLGSRWAMVVAPQPEVQPFAELRLGYVIGGLAALAGLAGLLSVPTGGVLLLLGTAFMFQGLAVVVWWSKLQVWPAGWWLGLIVVSLILPSFFLLVTMSLATIGFIDNWYGLRRTNFKL